jgi:hypothetical protein
MKKEPAWVVADRKRKGWRRLFGKTSRPKIRRKLNRKAKALAAANRRAWLGLSIGLLICAALFAMLLSVPPQMLPEQLADAVRLQKTHAFESKRVGQSSSIGPVDLASQSTNSVELVRKTAPSKPNLDPQLRTGYVPVSFEQLSSFRFFVTDRMLNTKKEARFAGTDQILEQLPEEVRALDQKAVSLRGFMLPMKLDGRLTTEFLLLKNQGLCCYGKPPKITEWVTVRVNGKGVHPIMDEPITVCGTFHVGDVRENGDLLGIYRLDADRFQGPRK